MDPKLLADIHEWFVRAQEVLEKHADYDADDDGKATCNEEASLLAEIQDNPEGGITGLRRRVENAMKAEAK